MPNGDDVRWFKNQFTAEIEAAIHETPLSLDLLTAIACQETGYLWQALRRESLSRAQILELCVGDTLDSNGGRVAFPKSKADLLARAGGSQMFEIAHSALIDMARYIPGYRRDASNGDKFCHGFGIFQRDLQFFRDDPGYFLQKRYVEFDACLDKCMVLLKHALVVLGLAKRDALTDLQMAAVAIVYNAGCFRPAEGLKQGYFNGSQYYGEKIVDFIRLSKSVESQYEPSPTPEPALYEVNVGDLKLRLRSAPSIDPINPRANVIAELAQGQIVSTSDDRVVNGFREVEITINGVVYRGFASAQFLVTRPDSKISPLRK